MNATSLHWAARAARHWVGAGLVLAALCGGPLSALAQAPAVPGAAAPAPPPGPLFTLGDTNVRFHFPLIDQLSYVQHPFYQITEDPAYAGGKAAGSLLTSIGRRGTDENASFLLKLIHALPPFGIEGVMGINAAFPRGIGWGFDFSPLTQNDVDAASGGGTVTAIQTDTYYYSGALRFYFFSPNEPGINYFVGLGLGFIEGTMEVPVAASPSLYVNYAQYPVGSTRLGLEALGESWGFRYELMVINAQEVKLDSNPYDYLGDGANPTTIDFSGSMVRLSLFYQF
jgi:hypothetical protein